MRIELEDILGDGILEVSSSALGHTVHYHEVSPVDIEHLGDALIRFRLARPRPPSGYEQCLGEPAGPAAQFPSVVEHARRVRQRFEETLAEQRESPLLRSAGVESVSDLLRFNEDHFCRPDWLYTNGQSIASVVKRPPETFETILHPSLADFLNFVRTDILTPLVDPGRGARFASQAATESWIGQRLSRILLRPLPVVRGAERSLAFLQEAGVRWGEGRPVRTFVIHHRGEQRRERTDDAEACALLQRLDLGGFRARCCATCDYFGFTTSGEANGGATGSCGQRGGDAGALPPGSASVSVFDTCELYEAVSEARRRRRCRQCGETFREDGNDDDACRHHPGELRDYDRFAAGSPTTPGDFWTCCKQQVGAGGRPVPGCVTSRHVESEADAPRG